MNATTPDAATPPHALSRHLAWMVGGGLALVAAGSLATALALRGPGAAGPAPGAAGTPAATAAAETGRVPRETIVSTMSPSPGPAAAPTTPAAAGCADCAVVRGVTAIERKGEPTGLGAVGGAVAGGLIGSQMGGGSGQDAMTVIGAVGGGVAGHHMERRLRSSTEYRVRVQMADGSTRTLSHPTRLAVGDAVRVDGERIVVATRGSAPAATRTAQSEPRIEAPAAAEPQRPRSMAEAKRL